MWSNSEYIWPNAQRNWPNARAFNQLRSHLATVGRVDQMRSAFGQTLRIWSNAARFVNFGQMRNAFAQLRCAFGQLRRLVKCALHYTLQEVMRIVRDFKCCAGCCWCACSSCCSMDIRIEAPVGEVAGYVRQQ